MRYDTSRLPASAALCRQGVHRATTNRTQRNTTALLPALGPSLHPCADRIHCLALLLLTIAYHPIRPASPPSSLPSRTPKNPSLAFLSRHAIGPRQEGRVHLAQRCLSRKPHSPKSTFARQSHRAWPRATTHDLPVHRTPTSLAQPQQATLEDCEHLGGIRVCPWREQWRLHTAARPRDRAYHGFTAVEAS